MNLILLIAFVLAVAFVIAMIVEGWQSWQRTKQSPNLSHLGEGVADQVVADVEAELDKLPIAGAGTAAATAPITATAAVDVAGAAVGTTAA